MTGKPYNLNVLNRLLFIKVLPTSRHIKELLNHAEEHLNQGSNTDLKFSLIHADNSIEIMLKEHLRYDKENS